MFLLEFEKKLVEYFYHSPLRVKQVFFGDGKYTFIDSFSKVKTMPYVHVSRTLTQDSLGKSVIVYDKSEKRTFYPIKLDYTVYCVVEKSVEMLTFMSDLRFYLSENPNMLIWYPRIEPRRIELGDTVYNGTGYDASQPADPEFRNNYCSTVDSEGTFYYGAKKIPYFVLSDGTFISYSGRFRISNRKYILDARDFIRIPDPVKVSLTFGGITLEEIQNSVSEKGPIRCIQIKIHSEMFTESLKEMPTFKSIKIIVNSAATGENFVGIEVSEESDEV